MGHPGCSPKSSQHCLHNNNRNPSRSLSISAGRCEQHTQIEFMPTLSSTPAPSEPGNYIYNGCKCPTMCIMSPAGGCEPPANHQVAKSGNQYNDKLMSPLLAGGSVRGVGCGRYDKPVVSCLTRNLGDRSRLSS